MDYSSIARKTAISPTNIKNFHVFHLMVMSWCHSWPHVWGRANTLGQSLVLLLSLLNGWLNITGNSVICFPFTPISFSQFLHTGASWTLPLLTQLHVWHCYLTVNPSYINILLYSYCPFYFENLSSLFQSLKTFFFYFSGLPVSSG